MHRLVGISEPTSRSYTWDSRGKQRVGIHARYFPSCYHLYNFLNRKKKYKKKVTANVFQREGQCTEGCNLCSGLGCVAGPAQRRKHDVLFPYQSGPGLDALSLGDSLG